MTDLFDEIPADFKPWDAIETMLLHKMHDETPTVEENDAAVLAAWVLIGGLMVKNGVSVDTVADMFDLDHKVHLSYKDGAIDITVKFSSGETVTEVSPQPHTHTKGVDRGNCPECEAEYGNKS